MTMQPTKTRGGAGSALLLIGAAATMPGAAHAYVGPGAGLTAIGTVIALLAALLLAVVGFVWYPVKRLLKKRGAARPSPDAAETPAATADRPR